MGSFHGFPKASALSACPLCPGIACWTSTSSMVLQRELDGSTVYLSVKHLLEVLQNLYKLLEDRRGRVGQQPRACRRVNPVQLSEGRLALLLQLSSQITASGPLRHLFSSNQLFCLDRLPLYEACEVSKVLAEVPRASVCKLPFRLCNMWCESSRHQAQLLRQRASDCNSYVS